MMKIDSTKTFLLRALILVLVLSAVLPALPVQAQAGSAYDLIAEVNALRAEYGLQPYQVDGGLMASAQAHSEYQASIQTGTHTRADGSSPASLGFTENIAYGGSMSVSYAVRSIWSDQLHMNTMVGYESGYVGAGVATDASGNVYYTLQVRSTGGYVPPVIQSTPVGGGAPVAVSTPQVVKVELTNTPNPDGSIKHKVEPGQTIWAIALAYGISEVELIQFNYLDAQNPLIYPGQVIIVQPAYTPTVTPTITNTLPPPTRTPRPTFTPRPTRPTATLAPTATPTNPPLVPPLNTAGRRGIGIGIILVCAAGLALSILPSVLKK